MREVQKISCINGGGFGMEFEVTDGTTSKATDGFNNPNYKTLNAKDMSLAEGTEIWPKIYVNEGDDRNGVKVTYKSNGQVAVYSVTGTTFNSSVDLIGGNG